MKIKNQNYLTGILFLLLLCSCQHTNDHGKSIKITDSYNRSIVLAKTPERVVSASPVITEIMFALGLQHKLVGRTDFCTYPPAALKIKSIGGLEDPGIETIASLNSDLVIASEHFRKDIADQLNHLGIKTAVFKNQASFEGTYDMINRISGLFGAAYRGDSIVNSMKKRVQKVQDEVKSMSYKPTVYIVIGFGKTGEFTAGGNTFINDMITIAGGKNVAADMNGWAYSLEKLIEKNPDLIIIRQGDREAFCNSKNYQSLKAVRTGHVYEVNNDLFDLTGPRLAEGVETLHKVFEKYRR